MRLVSIVCHPLLMATYLSIFLLSFIPELFGVSPQSIWYFILAIFLTTCFLPAISIWYLKFFSYISSLELPDKKERTVPFLIIAGWYMLASYLFVFKIGIIQPFSTMILSVTILIILLLLITREFKISIHSAAIWGVVGIIASLIITKAVDLRNLLYLFVILAGLTGTSRLYLGYHRPIEIWIGALLGFSFCFCALFFFG